MSKQKEKVTTASTAKTPVAKLPDSAAFAFGKENYVLLLISIAITIIGYMLMAGGKSTDPNVFKADEIFSFRRITLAPIIVMAGYILGIYAIVKKAK